MRDGGTGFDSRTCADPCGRVVGADGSLEHTAHRWSRGRGRGRAADEV